MRSFSLFFPARHSSRSDQLLESKWAAFNIRTSISWGSWAKFKRAPIQFYLEINAAYSTISATHGYAPSLLQDGTFELWERPLSGGAYAIAVVNRQEIGGPQAFLLFTAVLGNGLACNPACAIQQILPTSRDMGLHNWISFFKVTVNPTGTVLLKTLVIDEKKLVIDNGNSQSPNLL